MAYCEKKLQIPSLWWIKIIIKYRLTMGVQLMRECLKSYKKTGNINIQYFDCYVFTGDVSEELYTVFRFFVSKLLDGRSTSTPDRRTSWRLPPAPCWRWCYLLFRAELLADAAQTTTNQSTWLNGWLMVGQWRQEDRPPRRLSAYWLIPPRRSPASESE